MVLHCVPSFIFFFKFSPLQLLCVTCSSFHLSKFINSVTCHFPLLLVFLVCLVSFKFSKPSFLMYPQNFICHFLIGCNTCFVVLILIRTSSQLRRIIYLNLQLLFFFFLQASFCDCVCLHTEYHAVQICTYIKIFTV